MSIFNDIFFSDYRENLVKERISWEDHWSAVASPHFSVTS